MNPRTLQVVLIEDNSSDVFLIGKALREAGLKFSLRTFTNGEEALEFVETLEESGVPDIILMDWNLPRVHGKEILQAMDRVRCLGKTPRVVLTSSQSAGDRKEVEQMGGVFLSKPRTLDEFLRIGPKIKALLGER
jgi:chemotaxis family two-component system response regulator Rcp1